MDRPSSDVALDAPSDEAKTEERISQAPDALVALGVARAHLQTAMRNEPARSAKGSELNRAGLGGALHHIEFAIAELAESLREEEWAYVRHQGQGTARQPADRTATPTRA